MKRSKLRVIKVLSQLDQAFLPLIYKYDTPRLICGYYSLAFAQLLAIGIDPQLQSQIFMQTLESVMEWVSVQRKSYILKNHSKFKDELQRKGYLSDWVANYQIVDYLNTLQQEVFFARFVTHDIIPDFQKHLKHQELAKAHLQEPFKGQTFFFSRCSQAGQVDLSKEQFAKERRGRETLLVLDLLGHYVCCLTSEKSIQVFQSYHITQDHEFNLGIFRQMNQQPTSNGQKVDLVAFDIIRKMQSLPNRFQLDSQETEAIEMLIRSIEEIRNRTPLFEQDHTEIQAKQKISKINYQLSMTQQRLFAHIQQLHKQSTNFLLLDNKQESLNRLMIQIFRCQHFIVLYEQGNFISSFSDRNLVLGKEELEQLKNYFISQLQWARAKLKIQTLHKSLERTVTMVENLGLIRFQVTDMHFYLLFERSFDEFSGLFHHLSNQQRLCKLFEQVIDIFMDLVNCIKVSQKITSLVEDCQYFVIKHMTFFKTNLFIAGLQLTFSDTVVADRHSPNHLFNHYSEGGREYQKYKLFGVRNHANQIDFVIGIDEVPKNVILQDILTTCWLKFNNQADYATKQFMSFRLISRWPYILKTIVFNEKLNVKRILGDFYTCNIFKREFVYTKEPITLQRLIVNIVLSRKIIQLIEDMRQRLEWRGQFIFQELVIKIIIVPSMFGHVKQIVVMFCRSMKFHNQSKRKFDHLDKEKLHSQFYFLKKQFKSVVTEDQFNDFLDQIKRNTQAKGLEKMYHTDEQLLQHDSQPSWTRQFQVQEIVLDWDFDVLQLQPEGMFKLGINLFTNPLIDKQSTCNFVMQVQRSFSKSSNPFHNFTHSIATSHSLHFLLKAQLIEFNDLQHLALVASCLGHDLGHTGRSNSIECQTLSKLAITYNDCSVLENYSISLLFEIMSSSEVLILQNISSEKLPLFKKEVVEFILATDLDNYHELQEEIQAQKLFTDNRRPFTKKKMIFLAADLSLSVKNFDVSKQWVTRLHLELSSALEHSNLTALNSSDSKMSAEALIAKWQVQRLEQIILPHFRTMRSLWQQSEELVHILAQTEVNMGRWLQIMGQMKQSQSRPSA